MTRTAKAVTMSGVEFVFLLLLWFCFVSKFDKHEFILGVFAAAIGSVGDAIVKARGFAKFKPKLRWLLLIFLTPWYALEGTYAAFKAIARNLAGKRSQSSFKVSPYVGVPNDARSAAKRSLAIAFVTLSPHTIVVGIDKDEKQVLLHELSAAPVQLIGKELGIKE